MNLPFGELPEIELGKLCATSASEMRRIRVSASVSASWRSTTGDLLRLPFFINLGYWRGG